MFLRLCAVALREDGRETETGFPWERLPVRSVLNEITTTFLNVIVTAIIIKKLPYNFTLSADIMQINYLHAGG